MISTRQEQTDAMASMTDSGGRMGRRFSVSSNRARATHRVQYVETGGALVNNDDCTFCQSNPDLNSPLGTTSKHA